MHETEGGKLWITLPDGHEREAYEVATDGPSDNPQLFAFPYYLPESTPEGWIGKEITVRRLGLPDQTMHVRDVNEATIKSENDETFALFGGDPV